MPFSFNFLSSGLRIVVETLTSCNSFLSRHARFIIDSAVIIEDFSEDRSVVATCKMKLYGEFLEDGFVQSSIQKNCCSGKCFHIDFTIRLYCHFPAI